MDTNPFTEVTGDVQLVSLDGEFSVPFLRHHGAGDYDVLAELINGEGRQPMGYGRGMVERAMGGIRVVEV